jgi:hypothetical protein
LNWLFLWLTVSAKQLYPDKAEGVRNEHRFAPTTGYRPTTVRGEVRRRRPQHRERSA